MEGPTVSAFGRQRLPDWPLDPSIVYRALREMEEQDLVASNWDDRETQGPPRRVYHLTASGNEALACLSSSTRPWQNCGILDFVTN